MLFEQGICKRTASSRNQEKICHACAYRPKGKAKVEKPSWINCSSLKYCPSYNVSPQMCTPVILSSSHTHIKNLGRSPAVSQDPSADPTPLDEGVGLGERVLQPMKWGLVPSWRKAASSPLLNNCRLEGILERPSFRNAVEERRRCVVLADGYFEWSRHRDKWIYFIHFRDNKPTSEMEELGEEVKEEGEGGAGALYNVGNGRMLTMAGLFDICTDTPEGEALYSYTVITVPPEADYGPIQDRMPAILDGDEAIATWLDTTVPSHEALEILRPSSSLTWYPVSDLVEDLRKNTSECIAEMDPSKHLSNQQDTSSKEGKSQSPAKKPRKAKEEGEKAKITPSKKKTSKKKRNKKKTSTKKSDCPAKVTPSREERESGCPAERESGCPAERESDCPAEKKSPQGEYLAKKPKIDMF